LTETLISDGRQLLNELDREGVPAMGAYWDRNTDIGIWELNIVMPETEHRDPRFDVPILLRVLRRHPRLREFVEPLGLAPKLANDYFYLEQKARVPESLWGLDQEPGWQGTDLYFYRAN